MAFRVLILALVLLCPLLALDPVRSVHQYGHDRWDHMKGLPSQAIYDIYQTDEGYIWLHSGTGILRFDGTRFVPVKPSLEGKPLRESINAVGRGRSGGLVLRTETKTLALSGTRTRLIEDSRGAADGQPHVLLDGQDGSIWMGTDNHLYRIRDGRLERIISSCGYISSIVQDRQGAIWISAVTGVFRIQNDRAQVHPSDTFGSFVHFHLPFETAGPGEPRPKSPTALLEDGQGGLWIGSWEGLWRMDRNRLTRPTRVDPLLKQRITTLLMDKAGNLWAGTQKGLLRWAGGRWTTFSAVDGLSDDVVISLMEDQEGSLWIGTRTGLDRFRDTPLITMTTKEGLSADNIYGGLEARDGSLWVCSPEGGVSRIQAGRITTFGIKEGLASPFAGTLCEASDGTIWVGSDRGLSRIQNGRASAVHFPELDGQFISAISEDAEGLIVAAANLRMYRLKGGRLSPYDLKLAREQDVRYAFDIHRDEGGGHWFALAAGLYRVPPGQSPERAERVPFNSPAFSICDDGRGYLWIMGSQALQGGFTRISKATGELFQFPPEAGAEVEAMGRCLCDDEGNLWINTRKGLLIFQRRDLDEYAAGRRSSFTPRNFGPVDGLKTIDCGLSTLQPSAWRGRDGRMFFASSKGLVIANPRHLLTNPVPPSVQIEEMLADHTPLPDGTTLIPAGTEDLEIHYTALSLRVPEKVKFRYLLEGYDPKWVEAGSRRTAYYTRLSPRTYRFRVMACNDEGIWNETGASFQFTIKPRFVQTVWFYLLCAGALTGLVLLLHRFRTRQLRRRQQVLEALIDDRTHELQDEIQERTQAQESLLRYQDHLEQLVSDRTAELLHTNDLLHLEEQRYRNFFEEDVAGAFIATPEGAILACNPAFSQMLGLPDPQAVGDQELRDFFETPEEGEAVLERIRQEGKVLGIEIGTERNGRALHFTANLVGQFSPDGGTLLEIKGYVLDTTLRKDLEEQLRQSQKMEAIGQLAGGVAHDFNNILTVILGYSEILMAEEATSEEGGYLASGIKEAGERAAALTRQLLAFSRRQVMQPEQLSISSAVQPMEKMLRRLIGEHIAFSFELSPLPLYVKADPVQIEQVILNLVVNARDAMPTGGHIRLCTQAVVLDEGEARQHLDIKAGEYVCLSVQDTGCGISPEIIGRIFEPFFTTKGLGQGTGLGLSTVYGIVRQSGGLIDVQSEPGVGSTFKVLLPRIAHQGIQSPEAEPQPVPRGSETILMVEDDDLVRRMVQRTLTESGYRVLVASQGPEALELARQEEGPIHLLLTDVIMPGMNGLEVAQAMGQIRPDLPVLFVSGYMDEVLVRFTDTLGGIHLLGKPFTPVQLLRNVRELLDQAYRELPPSKG